MKSFQDVQSYLDFCEQGDLSAIRPQSCCHCHAERPMNRHGSFKRFVWCQDSETVIPAYRFRCPICLRTVSVVPTFIGRYERCTWDVQEDVLQAVDEACSCEQVGKMILPPTGPLSPRTVWRWTKKWRAWMNDLEPRFWSYVIQLNPFLRIPRGRDHPATQFALFRQTWRQVTSTCVSIRLLHALFRIATLGEIFND